MNHNVDFLTNFCIIAAITGIALTLIINLQFIEGWHQNLGLSDEKAAELYRTNPNDPQILAWANALQREYDQERQVCFEPSPYVKGIEKEIVESCNVLVPIIYDNCLHHPNSLLLCSDSRIASWVENIHPSGTQPPSEMTTTGRTSIPPVFSTNESSKPSVSSPNESSIPSVFKPNNNNYRSDSIGIQIDYPNNWYYTEGEGSIVYFIPKNESQSNLAPQFQKLYLLIAHDTTVNDKSISIKNYLEYSKKQLQNRNVAFDQANKTTLAGEPGYKIFFTNPNGNKGEIFIVTHKGKPYLISYVAIPEKFDQYLPVINDIVSSLKFT